MLFAIGSVCFLVAPFPGFLQLVGSGVDGIVFFVGSLFFTSAALLQYLEAANVDPGPAHKRRRLRLLTFEPERIDWWITGIQLVGTLLFNLNTFRAMQSGLSVEAVNRFVWAPDAVGSLCFLVSGLLAYFEACGGFGCRPRRDLGRWITVINLGGCVAFGVSAVASYLVPATGTVLNLAAANFATALGALCFLIGALLLLPEGAKAVSTPAGAPLSNP